MRMMKLDEKSLLLRSSTRFLWSVLSPLRLPARGAAVVPSPRWEFKDNMFLLWRCVPVVFQAMWHWRWTLSTDLRGVHRHAADPYIQLLCGCLDVIWTWYFLQVVLYHSVCSDPSSKCLREVRSDKVAVFASAKLVPLDYEYKNCLVCFCAHFESMLNPISQFTYAMLFTLWLLPGNMQRTVLSFGTFCKHLLVSI